jgi:hypothetical protein
MHRSELSEWPSALSGSVGAVVTASRGRRGVRTQLAPLAILKTRAILKTWAERLATVVGAPLTPSVFFPGLVTLRCQSSPYGWGCLCQLLSSARAPAPRPFFTKQAFAFDHTCSPIVSSPLVEHGFGAKLQVHGSEYAHRRDDDAVAVSQCMGCSLQQRLARGDLRRASRDASSAEAGRWYHTATRRRGSDRVSSVQAAPHKHTRTAQGVTDEGDSG